MGRSEKTRFIKSQIIRVAYNTVSDVIFHPATVALHRKPPSTRSKTRATRRKCLEECSSKLKLSLYRSTPSDRSTRSHASKELVLPTPHPIVREINHLEWMFDNEMCDNVDAWDVKEKFKQKNGLTAQEPMTSPPLWSEAPTSCPYRAVRKWISHLWEVGTSHYHLQIPSSWSVFHNVDWMQDGSFQLASNNSECLEGTDDSSGSSGSPQSSPPRPSQSTYSTPAITCRAQDLTYPRARGQWNTFVTMVPHAFDWKYQTDERALRRNQVRHTGCVDLNQQARNHDVWPQNSFPAVISHWEASRYQELLPTVHELKWPYMMGRWLVEVVATDMFPAQCEQPIVWPRSIMTGQTSTQADYICRATPESIGWREEMCPLLFAAHYNAHPSFRRGHYSVSRKLASIFQPTMAILILYYLDTRVSTDDPMPSWMVLFGINYDESGVVIRRHSPCFQPSAPYLSGTKSGGWRAISSVVDDRYQWDMLRLPERRGPLLSALNRIQGHSAYVLDRLKVWEGYERACQLLIG